MLGNLFSQRKREDEPVVSPQSAQPPVPQDQPVAVPPSDGQDPQASAIGSKMDPVFRQNLSALSHLDSRTTQVLHHAQEETKRIRQAQIEPEQLLLGLLYDEAVFKLLEEFEVDVAKLAQELQGKEKIGTFTGQPTLSNECTGIFEQAYRETKGRGESFVSPEDLLVAFLNGKVEATKALEEKGIKKEQIQEKVSKGKGLGKGKKSVLEQYGIDLTDEARAGKLDPIAGRDKEIERIIHIILRRTKNNPIIIGEAGVGKTAIVEGLAQKIVSGQVPKDLANKRIFQLDLASMIAGASHRGEFEERLKSIINETIASQGQIVLFIDEIHTLIGAGDNQGALDASNIIKPHLARGHMQIIGTTTTTEYRKHFEKDKAFERRFQPILCEEPNEEVAVEMLQVIKPKYEKFHNVTFPDDTLKAAVKLSKKYIGERHLPDKAVDLLDEAGAQVKLEVENGKRQSTQVEKKDIEVVVSNWTGIPITKLTEDESAKLLKLEDKIHERLIDQQEAVTAVAEAVRRGRIGLSAANRPIASFIFLGPTGVGKTELAKTLAELLFGRDDALVRLDMSEYMEKHEVAKLIGAPPGYVGYEEGGQLTEAVRQKPYSIVLLDEVEKAHPDVFNILLQLLEDGRLTDNKGNTISFKNTIVICTSNIGSAMIQQKLSDASGVAQKTEEQQAVEFGELSQLVSDELHKFFRPELLNRFDDIVIFKPLRKQDMSAIAKLGIAKTAKLLEEQGYNLSATDQAIAQLAEEGYDPVYGARPLRRLIQTAIENQIALLIIGKTFVPGDTIQVDYDQTKSAFVFSKGSAPVSTGTSEEQQEPPKEGESATAEPSEVPVEATSSEVPQEPQLPPSSVGEAMAMPQEVSAAPEPVAPATFNPPFLQNQEEKNNGQAQNQGNGLTTSAVN